MKPILAASAALAAYLAWRSLGWPLIHDAPLMHYVAWVITQGGVPYRDVFDMNLPGVYLIHAAVIGLLGGGDLAWRLFDLGWLAASAALLWAYARPLGAGPATAGALLWALYHLSGGAWRAGQRDFLLCLFLLAGAYGVARSIERGGALGPLGWGGLALGVGMTVKPQAGAFWMGAAALGGWGAWRGRRFPLAASGAVLAAGLAAPALIFGWLAWRGGLAPFAAVFGGYVVPLYGHLARVPPWQPFGWYRFGWALWGLLAILAALGLWTRAPGVEARKAVAAVGAISGALHFALQGKGWEYQLYPLAVFVCALASVALRPADLAAGARRGRAWVPAGFSGPRRAAALATFAAVAMVLGAKGVDALDEPWIARKAALVSALTRDLAPRLPPGATVQVMDVTEGGVHALWNLRLRQPTRFIYDFHFFHDTGDARIAALREEFAAALAGRPPAAIVVLRDTWNRPGYGRVDDWPAVAELLARSYMLAVEGDGYRIYVQRAHS